MNGMNLNQSGDYTPVFSRFKAMVENQFPVARYALVFEPADVTLLVHQPKPGMSAIEVKIIDLETGNVVRNAFGVRITDPEFDPFGFSKLQTDALRNLLKYCGYADAELMQDDEETMREFIAHQQSSAVANPAQEDDLSVRIVVDDTPEPEGAAKAPAKKVPERKRPTDAQRKMLDKLAAELGVSLREPETTDEVKAMLGLLREAKKRRNGGDEDYAKVLVDFLAEGAEE